jgi:hypothetical protein
MCKKLRIKEENYQRFLSTLSIFLAREILISACSEPDAISERRAFSIGARHLVSGCNFEPDYAAPNLTDTSFDTPGSCMVTP